MPSSLTDENRSLRKQIGSIFQIFDRRHILSSSSRRFSSHDQTRQDPLEQKEKPPSSLDSTPRASILGGKEKAKPPKTPPRSPDLRDVVKDSIRQHLDSPRPLRPRPTDKGDHNEMTTTTTMVMAPRRFSFDGREPKSSSARLNELPRLSLDSRTPGNHTRSSSVVAKLMGLESFPELDEKRAVNSTSNAKEIHHSQNVFSQSPASPSPRLGQATSQDSCYPSVYGAIEKRIAEIEFEKWGKDLRALKQILEAMEKTRERIESQIERSAAEASAPRRRKTSEDGCYDRKIKGRPSPPKATDRASMDVLNVHRLQSSSGKSIKETSKVPPRRKAAVRDVENEESTRPKTPTSEPVRAGKHLGKTVVERSSQGKMLKLKSSEVNGEADNCVEKQTSYLLKTIREPTEEISTEQPSPVSVLDAAFYGEDPPSPLRKITLTFRDDEDPISDGTKHRRSDMALAYTPEFEMATAAITKRAAGPRDLMIQSGNLDDDDDEDGDGMLEVLASDMKNESEDWTRCKSEVSALVLDVERLIFKGLVNEVFAYYTAM